MPGLSKVFILCVFFVISTEGKTKKNEGLIPIEVVLNPNGNGKASVPESRVIKNKAIELKIHSDDRERGGKVDLIIAATNEVESTEKKVDRYSPAFNSEHDLLNSEIPRDFKSGLKLNRNWDTSRQDSLAFYPPQSGEVFPFLMLRQVLQTSQPLMLHQNQFTPLQTLRSFEDNLQRELLPHINQGIGPIHNTPMSVVRSQPIYTGGVSPNSVTQKRLTPQLLSMIQRVSLQQHGLLSPIQQRNRPLNFPQQEAFVQNPPLNRYPLANGSPQGVISTSNQNVHLNNGLPNNLQNPFQHYSQPQRVHQLPTPQEYPRISPQPLPEILDSNRQPLPVHNRPGYTLDRNLQTINLPFQRIPYQQNIVPRQIDQHQQSNLNQLNQITRNYPQNQEYALIPYKPIINDQPRQNPYNLQQPSIHPHQSYATNHPTATDVTSNNQQHLYRLQNTPPADQNKNHPLPDRYRPPPREYRTSNLEPERLIQSNLPTSTHQNVHPQQLPQNDFKNSNLRNGPGPRKIPEEDERKIPGYRHSPEGTRSSYYQNPPQPSSYPQKHKSEDSGLQQSYHSEPINTHRQHYHEPSYGSQSRSTDIGSSDSSKESEEIPEREQLSKYNTPTKKRRKLRNRKRTTPKDKSDDLDGHASHQYIIKIG